MIADLAVLYIRMNTCTVLGKEIGSGLVFIPHYNRIKFYIKTENNILKIDKNASRWFHEKMQN